MTKEELITLLEQEVKGLTSYLVSDDYNNACDDSSRETGWGFPVSGDFKIFWIKQRAKRHLFFYLFTESAHKFKFEQINLQHRFDHYKEIIKDMDISFVEIQESRPEEFAQVSSYKMFGHKIDAGFQYESQTGRDYTYDEDNEIIVTP
ncbi:MAG: hypothetical protein SV062_12945 [Thermodesulfobacteriota bacterium]|nr:hypothetical protein [Thermodesulfobacteriota bacterium]